MIERSAGIVTRAAAAAVDALVVSIALAVLYVGWVFTRLAFTPRSFEFPAVSVLFSALGFLALATLYLAVCWAVSGCTAGAVVMGVRVVGRSSIRLHPLTALLRALICVAFPAGLAWVVVDRQRRSVQDIALRTRVVYRHDAPRAIPVE